MSVLALGLLAEAGLGDIRLVPGEYPSIQRAIRDCNDGDTVIVAPGVYYETINFSGKNITVTSTDPNDPKVVGYTILNAEEDGTVVTFENGETSRAVLIGFTLTGGFGTFSQPLTNEVGGVRTFAGAGVYCNGASPTITKNVVVRNKGPLNVTGPTDADVMITFGGGICCYDCSPTITHNVIRDNSAWVGGGILCWFGEPTISDNIIAENSGYQGGGVFMFAGSLYNNTIVGNDGGLGAEIGQGDGYGGNAYAVFAPQLGYTRIFNNIICGAPSGSGILWEGDIREVYFAFNNLWDNFPGNYSYLDPESVTFVSGGEGDQTGTLGNISEDPLFVDPFTRDYHLTLESPCINTGDPDFVFRTGLTDIDGEDRVYGRRIDMGADEYVGYVRPVAIAGLDQHVLEPLGAVTLDASGSFFHDPCGVRTFQWGQVDGPSVTLDDPNSERPTFVPETEGEYVFELVVTDDRYPSEHPDRVLVYVGPNRLPVAHAGSDKVWQTPWQVTLDGTGSFDPDPAERLSYSWTQLEGPAVTLQHADTATPSFAAEPGGRYVFELVVNDGFGDSDPSRVQLVTVGVTIDALPLDMAPDTDQIPHYPDISGTRVVFAIGSGDVHQWEIAYRDFKTGEADSFSGGGISIHPRIHGDLVVWSGGPYLTGGDGPECTSVFVRNLATNAQATLRAYSDTQSFSHPAVSGSKVVWVQHLNVDKNAADQWHNMPYDICGADISDPEHPAYFTIATNVGRRDPFPYEDVVGDFDDVIDISGNIVVWEGNGDIYAADISDLDDIKVFTVCDHPARQYDPAVSGRYVVWTDERNDSGDIYGADIADPEHVTVFEIAKAERTQSQPAVDGCTVVYVAGEVSGGRIRLACITRNYGVLELALPGVVFGVAPALDGTAGVWLNGPYGPAQGIRLALGYSMFDGLVRNVTTGRRYDYVQHAISDALPGEEIVVPEGVHQEEINFVGKALTVRSTDPNDPAVVAATILQADGHIVTFAEAEDADSVLDGLTITRGHRGIYCYGASPTVRRCTITSNRGAGVKLLDQSHLAMTRSAIAGNGGVGIEMWAPATGRRVEYNFAELRNCVIAGNRGEGIRGGKPTITNCTIVENLKEGIADAVLTATNSIVYFNDREGAGIQIEDDRATVTYCDVEGGWPGDGNIDADPLFVELGHWTTGVLVDPADPDMVWVAGDYHLQSEGWRWDGPSRSWVSDAVSSPCIDAGDPASALLDELVTIPQDPSGEPGVNLRINMGAYGGTAEASLAPLAN